MKYHLAGYGISALVHAIMLMAVLPVLLWQDNRGSVTEPQPVPLSLARFVPAPLPPEPPVPQSVAEPVEKPDPPKPKPVEKPRPEPKKPTEKNRPEPKPVKKTLPEPQPKPVSQEQSRPFAPSSSWLQKQQPQPLAQPVPVAARPVAPVPKPPSVVPMRVAENPAAEAAYKERLQNLIATRKHYPHLAAKAEVEGTVVVSFTALPDGRLTGVRIAKSAGHDWLDKAAIQAVNAASGVLPFPPEIRKSQWTFSVTVNFRLE